MKKKTWKYHTSHSFTDNKGKRHNFITQLFQTGVYGIFYNDPGMQFSYSPANVVKIEKLQAKEQSSGRISDLQFGREITVTEDEYGLYVEVK